jgi:hypothetical protein
MPGQMYDRLLRGYRLPSPGRDGGPVRHVDQCLQLHLRHRLQAVRGGPLHPHDRVLRAERLPGSVQGVLGGQHLHHGHECRRHRQLRRHLRCHRSVQEQTRPNLPDRFRLRHRHHLRSGRLLLQYGLRQFLRGLRHPRLPWHVHAGRVGNSTRQSRRLQRGGDHLRWLLYQPTGRPVRIPRDLLRRCPVLCRRRPAFSLHVQWSRPMPHAHGDHLCEWLQLGGDRLPHVCSRTGRLQRRVLSGRPGLLQRCVRRHHVQPPALRRQLRDLRRNPDKMLRRSVRPVRDGRRLLGHHPELRPSHARMRLPTTQPRQLASESRIQHGPRELDCGPHQPFLEPRRCGWLPGFRVTGGSRFGYCLFPVRKCGGKHAIFRGGQVQRAKLPV